jgi:hypothetical protein
MTAIEARYLIRILLPLISSAMSVMASLFERDIVLELTENNLKENGSRFLN